MSNFNTDEFFMMNFGKDDLPKPTESKEKTEDKYVRYGSDNKYPNWLLKLYSSCPIHGRIINSKSTYIIGDGLGSNQKPLTVKVNDADGLQDLVRKCVKDFLIFGYFDVEVVYGNDNKPLAYHHVPAQKIRASNSKTNFWFSDESWVFGKHDYQLERFKPYLGASDQGETRLFHFDGYFPTESNVYMPPEYQAAIDSIHTDILLRIFNRNNAANHFSLSTLITFFNGSNLSEEAKYRIIDGLTQSYTGVSGKKMMVDFQTSEGKGAEVKNISPNDWDKAYVEVSKAVRDDIFIGHDVTSPMLFGVKTEGQLGGATELETMYEVFVNTYVRDKRNELETAFNMLFENSSIITERLEFIDRPLFSAKTSDELKQKIMTMNELRQESGLQPHPDGDRFLKDAAKEEEAQGEGKVYKVVQKMAQEDEYVRLTDEDFEKVSEMGFLRDDFEVLREMEFVSSADEARRLELRFEDERDIAQYILDNGMEDATPQEVKTAIRRDLGITVTVAEARSTISSLKDSGLTGKPRTSQDAPVEVMYSYEVRPGYGPEVMSTSRSFCKKLMGNNRLYTRQDIQTMSSIFGYDIYTYGGGFYRKSDGRVSPHCRHYFKAVTVTRKTK